MATFRTIKSGNWSDAGIWDVGSVPTDLGTVVLDHDVIFDVDQSSFSSGIASLEVNSLLSFDTGTASTKYMKLLGLGTAPTVFGSGTVVVGSPDDPVRLRMGGTPTVTIRSAPGGTAPIFSGLGGMILWGEGREGRCWDFCKASSGSSVVLKNGMDLSAGDSIAIFTPPIISYRSVLGYSGGTITLDYSLFYPAPEDATVILLTKPIQVESSSWSTFAMVDGMIAKDVYFYYSTAIGGADSRMVSGGSVGSCSARSVYNGLLKYVRGGTVDSCAASNVYNGILYGCYDSTVSDSCSQSIAVGVACESFNCTIQSSVAHSFDYGLLSDCVACNVIGGSAMLYADYGGMYLGGALATAAHSCSFYGATGSANMYGAFDCYGSDNRFYGCTLKGGEGAFYDSFSGFARSCTIGTTPVVFSSTFSQEGMPNQIIELVDCDTTGSLVIYSGGGSAVAVTTPTPPFGSVSYRLHPADRDAILVPFEVQIPAGRTLSVIASFYRTAAISGTAMPGHACPFVEIVDPALDPRLPQFTGATDMHFMPLAIAHSGTAGSCTWENVSVEWTNDWTAPRLVVVRVGQNGQPSGSAWAGTAYVALDWRIDELE